MHTSSGRSYLRTVAKRPRGRANNTRAPRERCASDWRATRGQRASDTRAIAFRSLFRASPVADSYRRATLLPFSPRSLRPFKN
eukprot:7078653-Karenia_brevis.AAC.1